MVRVELVAKDETYALPSRGALMIPDESTVPELNNLLMHLLGDLYPQEKSFNFQLGGRALHPHTSVGALCSQLELSPETLLRLEYYLPQEDPQPEREIEEKDWIRCVAICPTFPHRLLSGSFDRRVRLYPEEVTFAPAKDKVTALAWLDHDRFIAGSGDGTVLVWSVQDVNRPLWKGLGCTSAIQAIAVSKDLSYFLVADFEGQICKYPGQPSTLTMPKGGKQRPSFARIPEQSPLFRLQAHEGAVSGLFLSPLDKGAPVVVSLGWDGYIKVRSLDNPTEEIRRCKTSNISAAVHLGGLRFATGHPDGSLRVLDLHGADTIVQEGRPAAHEGWIMAIAAHSYHQPGDTQRFVTCGADGQVKLWDASDLSQPTSHLTLRPTIALKVLCVDWHKDSLVYGGEDKILHILST